jgi:hypothetical protein
VGSRPNRVIAAVELLKAEAFELEQQFNYRYPVLVQEGRITNLLGMSHRIRLLRHLANQIETI